MGLKPATIKFNQLQKLCSQCCSQIKFPFKEKLKSEDRYREIRKGYCENPECRQYKDWMDVEFITRESVLDLGHKYFDGGNYVVGYTATGVASDAVKQKHNFGKSKKKVVSDLALEAKRRERSSHRASTLLNQFEQEDAESIRWNKADRDKMEEIRARVLARRKLAESK